MKFIFSLILITGFFSSVHSQNDSLQAPFKRFPTFPPVKLLLPDSSFFTKEDLSKKSAVMVMLFSPDCEHCQKETELLVQNMDRFKKIEIVMATYSPFEKMLDFRKKYGLERFRNIIVGYDQGFFLPTFFDIRNLPFFAFYDRKKELISVSEGSISLDKVLQELEK